MWKPFCGQILNHPGTREPWLGECGEAALFKTQEVFHLHIANYLVSWISSQTEKLRRSVWIKQKYDMWNTYKSEESVRRMWRIKENWWQLTVEHRFLSKWPCKKMSTQDRLVEHGYILLFTRLAYTESAKHLWPTAKLLRYSIYKCWRTDCSKQMIKDMQEKCISNMHINLCELLMPSPCNKSM